MDINKELTELYALEQKAEALRVQWKEAADTVIRQERKLLEIDTENWDEARYFAPPELLEQGVIAQISVGCVISFLKIER